MNESLNRWGPIINTDHERRDKLRSATAWFIVGVIIGMVIGIILFG